jgi:hypothetical protein
MSPSRLRFWSLHPSKVAALIVCGLESYSKAFRIIGKQFVPPQIAYCHLIQTWLSTLLAGFEERVFYLLRVQDNSKTTAATDVLSRLCIRLA